MKKNQNLFDITTEILRDIESVLKDFQPHIILVHGDTTTGFVSALSGYYQKILVGHVEAGLRTDDIYSPYPEEMNRRLIGRLASYHFAPTQRNFENLIDEGIDEQSIIITGNTVIDALTIVNKKISSNKEFKEELIRDIINEGYLITEKKIILVTGHRRENFGEGFLHICNALKDLAHLYPDVDIVYPVHLNPNVREPVNAILSDIENIFLIEPLKYGSFLYLMSKAYLVLTDSGGIQEEAPSFGKPVLVMRDYTERPEGVNAGTVKLVGANQDSIITNVQKLMDDKHQYDIMSTAHNPYGEGHASERIIEFIQQILS
jgi:UDP-N-acetylglucosamine 2-epimerase (non-hydrolysing)